MSRNLRIPCALVLGALTAACVVKNPPQAGAADTSGRNLALAPTESSVHALNDRPVTRQVRPSTPAPKHEAPPKLASSQPASAPAAEPVTPAPSARALATGTVMSLAVTDTVTSRHSNKGDAVEASVDADVKDALGRTVIPSGAVVSGTVSDIDAGHPGSQGRLLVTFNRVQFGGKTYSLTAHVDTMAVITKGRGVTTTDAAKVGAGAVIGGIAGRLIGGNRTGTLVGAAAGGAAGAGVASKTRDIDVILPAGALVRLSLTAPFDLKEAQ